MDTPLDTAADQHLTLQRCQRQLAVCREGHWECDLQSGNTWCSPQLLALLGLDAGSVDRAETTIDTRLHPDDRPSFLASCLAEIQQPGGFDCELRFLDGANRWRWLQGRVRLVSDAAGEPGFLCGSVQDAGREKSAIEALGRQQRQFESELGERTAALQTALALAEQRRAQAELANAAKSRFLAHMSHEIRTPLNGVLGLTELAQRSAHNAEQRRYLQAAHQSGQALLQMTSDVLDLSRIEAGQLALHPRAFDPSLLLAQALRTVMPQARQRQLLLRYDWIGESPWVLADDGNLRQIVTNLLGNAIKFTVRGHVTLCAHARTDADGQLAMRIEVIDSGPGIAAERQPEVFKAFVQGDDGRGRGGAGLGLAIARQLAEAMGGQLGLHSPAQGGCTFSLELRAPIVAVGAQPPGPPPGRAWLVYPQREDGQWLAARLARLGWDVEVVPGVAEAVARAQRDDQVPPDLVIVAGMSLHHSVALGPLRQALPRAQLRLLIRPDWHEPTIEALAAELRMTPLLAPLTPAQLARIGMPIDEAGAVETDAALRVVPSALRQGADVLLVEDNPVNQLVGQEFLRALGLNVRLAEGGEAALAACTERLPDLVLMDLQMPGMDGLEATRALRRLQRELNRPALPIVALTAHAGPEDHAACHDAGMDGVLTKPLAMATLGQQLARWLPGGTVPG